MDAISTYLPLFFSGLAIHILTAVWRATAARWGEWGPRRKKYTKGLFIACAVMLFLYVVGTLGDPNTREGIGLFFVVAGVAAPEAFRRWRAGAEGVDLARLTGPADPNAIQLAVPGLPPVPVGRRHLLLAGNSPARDVLLAQMLVQMRARGDTLVVLDPDGRLAATHFDADTDFIFNPFDPRCISWSPLAEQRGRGLAQLAASLVQCAGVQDPRGLVQLFLLRTMEHLEAGLRLSLTELLYLTQRMSREELIEQLGEDAELSEVLHNPAAFDVLRQQASFALAGYEFLPGGGDAFSVTEMLEAGHSGAVFLTAPSDRAQALRGVNAFFTEAAFAAMLRLPADATRRVWFLVPDAASLAGMSLLPGWFAPAEEAGASLILGVPSIASLHQGVPNEPSKVLDAVGVRLVFNCRDELTAQALEPVLAPTGGARKKVQPVRAEQLRALKPTEVLLQRAPGSALLRGQVS